MALQTDPLSPRTAAGTSTPIVVAAGASVTVGIYAATDLLLLASESFTVLQTTPGASNYIGSLGGGTRSVQLIGPGTFTVKKPATASAFGVFLDA